MKKEFKTPEKFRDYCVKNCQKGIQAKKVISELLKNEEISKPKNLKILDCAIKDLRIDNKNIKKCMLTHVFNTIEIEY